MPKVEMDVETTLPPERVKEALLDFSDRRPEIWTGIDPTQYEVYSVSETSAEIREGTKLAGAKVWARERYDWSQPNTIRWTVEESNSPRPAATWTRRSILATAAAPGSTSNGTAPTRAWSAGSPPS